MKGIKRVLTFRKLKREKNNDTEKEYYAKVKDIFTQGVKERQKFRRDISKMLKLSDSDELRLEVNLSILDHVLTKDGNILKTSTLDENEPRESPERKSESDVLEAFVRINLEGTRLSRSDIIFSMLKLNWKESAVRLPEFVESVNKGNSFELDSDFVIRCLFAVSDLGTKFDINLLRKRPNIEKIQENFQRCCDAISSTVDFVQSECWIESSRLLRGYHNLIPLVYYLFHAKDHQVPNSQIGRIRKAIYLSGFTTPFSRYADSRLGKFIRQELKPLAEKNDEKFPLEEALWWVWYWDGADRDNTNLYSARILQRNPSLALHLVQRRTGAKVHYDKNAPQIDHIFPASVLRKKGVDEADINHYANFWILAKNKNQNKSNIHPKKYFEDVSDPELERAYIDRKLLGYPHYKTFLKNRGDKILMHVRKELKLSESDFDVAAHWTIE